MVRSDRYRWYELDRAKLYGESDDEQYKNGQRPERQQRIFARDCAANAGSGGFAVICRAAKDKNQREAASSRNQRTRPSTG